MNINKVPAIIIKKFHSTFTQVHLKTKNVICEQCGSTFYHASNLKRHREAVHLVKWIKIVDLPCKLIKRGRIIAVSLFEFVKSEANLNNNLMMRRAGLSIGSLSNSSLPVNNKRGKNRVKPDLMKVVSFKICGESPFSEHCKHRSSFALWQKVFVNQQYLRTCCYQNMLAT